MYMRYVSNTFTTPTSLRIVRTVDIYEPAYGSSHEYLIGRVFGAMRQLLTTIINTPCLSLFIACVPSQTPCVVGWDALFPESYTELSTTTTHPTKKNLGRRLRLPLSPQS